MIEVADAIVVHFGSFDLLDTCLQHLRSQVRSVIVVNNDDLAIPDVLKSRYPDVLWDEPGANLGFGRGVNRGCAYLDKTSYILVVNPDVTIGNGLISGLVSYLNRNPNIAMVGPRLLHPDGSLQTSGYRLPTIIQLIGYLLNMNNRVPQSMKRLLGKTPMKHQFGQLDPHDDEKTVEMITGACMMIRPQALFDAGPFDPGFFLYYEEKDFCKRLGDAGWSVGFTPDVTAYHVIGGSGSPLSSDATRHRAIGALRYFRRHGTWVAAASASTLFAMYAAINIIRSDRRQVYRDILTTSLSRAFPCDSCS